MSDTDDVLRVLVSTAPDRETALSPSAAYRSLAPTEQYYWARFADRFLSNGMEAGVVDMDDYFNSSSWMDAVHEEWPDKESDS